MIEVVTHDFANAMEKIQIELEITLKLQAYNMK